MSTLPADGPALAAGGWQYVAKGARRPKGPVLVAVWPSKTDEMHSRILAIGAGNEYRPSPKIAIAEWRKSAWRECDGRGSVLDAYAWMPLPPPPYHTKEDDAA